MKYNSASITKPTRNCKTNSGQDISRIALFDPKLLTSRSPAQELSFGSYPRLVYALDHIQRMRGGSQSHLMRCSDGFNYVVKFQNNPQRVRILANDMLGTLLAGWMGLPVAPFALVEVGEELISTTPELLVKVGSSLTPCRPGIQFGSRYAFDPLESIAQDFLRDEDLVEIENLSDFLGMLVFDKWTSNTDCRQVVFHRGRGQTRFHITMIDQGFCFNGEKWGFPDYPFIGIYPQLIVYRSVRGMESFAKWLSVLENPKMTTRLENAAVWIPSEWYGHDASALNRLVERLDQRRMRVRELLEQLRAYCRNPFPNWRREGQPFPSS